MKRDRHIPTEQRLLDLASGYFDQTLSAAERDELERRLAASPAARAVYWDMARMHGVGREWGLAADAHSVLAEHPIPMSRYRHRRAWWVSAAAVLVCVLGLAAWLMIGQTGRPAVAPTAATHPADPASLTFAMVDDATDAVWAGPGVIPPSGGRVGSSFLILQAGAARIQFDTGAEVLVDAPAELSLVAGDSVRLHSGRLLVHAPPQARGFTVHAGTLAVIDRGTEFGVSASTESPTEIHVFEGVVDVDPAMDPERAMKLVAGQAARWRDGEPTRIGASPNGFPSRARFASARDADQRRLEAWRTASRQLSALPGVVAHFRFEHSVANGETIPNDAYPSQPLQAKAENVTVAAGRWADKPAVQFARRSDRIRLQIPGTYDALTLAAWVRLDGLPNGFNGLLRADVPTRGAVHWHIDRLGRLRFGYPTGSTEFKSPESDSLSEWDKAIAPPLLADRIGRWVFVATTYDAASGVAVHYIDGVEVHRHVFKRPAPVHFGKAMLGNGAGPGDNTERPNAGLNLFGRMDEFLMLGRVLSADEIARIYEQGKTPS